METNDLLKSTLTDESRKWKGDTKTCLFCGLSHCFRTIRSWDHLGLGRPFKTAYPARVSLGAVFRKRCSRLLSRMNSSSRGFPSRPFCHICSQSYYLIPSSPLTLSVMYQPDQYEEFRIACTGGRHNLHSDMKDREPEAFHEKCMKSDIHRVPALFCFGM